MLAHTAYREGEAAVNDMLGRRDRVDYRAIPSVIDGLKPVQRKILYTMFNDSNVKRSKEIKVFQLCGYVGAFANYHHGDQSLNAAIIKMAQSYPGSNNLPLIDNASDGFGSRQENGNDCGQPRYLTVKNKSKIARLVFPAVDDNVLTSRIEDNEKVEPIYYVPIIPVVIISINFKCCIIKISRNYTSIWIYWSHRIKCVRSKCNPFNTFN